MEIDMRKKLLMVALPALLFMIIIDVLLPDVRVGIGIAMTGFAIGLTLKGWLIR